MVLGRKGKGRGLLPENWVCVSVGVELTDTAKPQIWRRKDLLARLPRVRRTGDLSQSNVYLKSKTGEVFS